MRPGQNKRMRGRNNNNNNNGGNRRGPNPLTRSYESNGPDVKIRGTAQHIGEKYLQLARDAQTSGDPVAAENYLQHAEHYFRIIATAQQAQQQAQTGYQRQPGEMDADEGDDDDLVMPDRFSLPSERFAAQQQSGQGTAGTTNNGNAAGTGTGTGTGPQPYPERGGFNGERQGQTQGNGSERYDRPQGETGYRDRDQRQDRSDQGQNREQRQDREYRTDQRQDRDQRQDQRQDRSDQRQDRSDQRQDRDQRPYGERTGSDRNGGERGYRNERNARGSRFPRDGQDQRGERDQTGYRETRYAQPSDQPSTPAAVETSLPEPTAVAAELPAFITAPVRPVTTQPPVVDEVAEAPAAMSEPQAEAATAQPAEATDGEAFTVRPRRRRRTRAMIEADAAAAAAAAGEPPASE